MPVVVVGVVVVVVGVVVVVVVVVAAAAAAAAVVRVCMYVVDIIKFEYYFYSIVNYNLLQYH